MKDKVFVVYTELSNDSYKNVLEFILFRNWYSIEFPIVVSDKHLLLTLFIFLSYQSC